MMRNDPFVCRFFAGINTSEIRRGAIRHGLVEERSDAAFHAQAAASWWS
jgi:hypothetical protein